MNKQSLSEQGSNTMLFLFCTINMVLVSCITLTTSANTVSEVKPQVEASSNFQPADWQLVWQDEFDYADKVLDEHWEAQHGPSNHILSSRWRENVEVKDGVLYLINRKENRGGQQWTSGSIRTKKQLGYGYYEARYKYAASNGTNNSFWLMSYPNSGKPAKGKRFELDINEGHYPNEVNTNIHNWTDLTVNENGKKTHPSKSRTYTFGTKHKYNYPLEIPITTTRVRFISSGLKRFHIRDFNVYGPSSADSKRVNMSQMTDLTVRASNSENIRNLLDDNIETSWLSQVDGEKWIEFEWEKPKTVSEIEFINGWKYKGNSWNGLITDFKIQYYTSDGWRDIATLNVEKQINFAEEYHVYGLEWNEEELVFYFDGKEIRREKNEFAHSLTPIWLSLAIIEWDGPVTDKIEGTSMKVDYVRYFEIQQ